MDLKKVSAPFRSRKHSEIQEEMSLYSKSGPNNQHKKVRNPLDYVAFMYDEDEVIISDPTQYKKSLRNNKIKRKVGKLVPFANYQLRVTPKYSTGVSRILLH